MKIKAPVMIQDQMVAHGKGLRELTEPIHLEEAFSLDGPVSERVGGPSKARVKSGSRL